MAVSMFDWLEQLADWLIFAVMGFPKDSHAASAVNFFFFDTVKIFVLLTIIVFGITVVRGFFPPERTRRILAAKKSNLLLGHMLAAMLGIVTPFCSCSAVPLFIGFVEAGIPLGVTFSYLVAAPMVNEVALGLLFSLFGWKIAVIYVFSGEAIAIVSGLVIGRLNMERFIESIAMTTKVGAAAEGGQPSRGERLRDAWIFTRDLLKSIWPYVVGGIALGALMHGWVPAGALARVAGRGNPFAVLVAVAIGVPLYSNAAGIIPLVSELTRAGVAMGTALAFMMAVTALSMPEMILLRRVLKPKLLTVFIAIVGAGIVFTGYLFNVIL
jgi:uncharacterized membrane protein YraQ (UPF0718 family)